MSGHGCSKALVGTGSAISLLCMNGLRKHGVKLVGLHFCQWSSLKLYWQSLAKNHGCWRRVNGLVWLTFVLYYHGACECAKHLSNRRILRNLSTLAHSEEHHHWSLVNMDSKACEECRVAVLNTMLPWKWIRVEHLSEPRDLPCYIAATPSVECHITFGNPLVYIVFIVMLHHLIPI